jgi:hypothetical protein
MRKPTQPKKGNGSVLFARRASTICIVATLQAARFKRSIASLQSAKRQAAVEATLRQKFLAALASRPAEWQADSYACFGS